MRIEFVTSALHPVELRAISAMLATMAEFRESQHDAQPAVASNPGSLEPLAGLSPITDGCGNSVGDRVFTAEGDPAGKAVDTAAQGNTPESGAAVAVTDKPKRTRKEKPAIIEADGAKTVDNASDGAPNQPQAYTLDDVRTALQAINAKHGMAAAKEFLESFSVSRISELMPETYGPFVEACNKKVAE